eukprot:scpid57490/ scgid0890/ 
MLQATLKLADKRGLAGYVPTDEQLLRDAIASNVTKLKLMSTHDGSTPSFYMHQGRGKDGRMHRFRRQMFFGVLYEFTLSWALPAVSAHDLGSGIESPSFVITHHFTVNRDLRKKFYLFKHRVFCTGGAAIDGACSAESGCDERQSTSSLMSTAAQLATGSSTGEPVPSLQPWKQCQQHGHLPSSFHAATTLTVLSYNIWNFNPADAYDDEYAQRVKRIGRLVRQSGAAIIAFQEVRFDYGRGGHLGPSQVDHLSAELKGFQFVFQAAMTYPEGIHGRVEEGPAVFSAFPIISSDYIFLPRDLENDQDVHQRILLHAQISTPQVGLVHLFVTHLSLSEVARNRSVVRIWQYMKQFDGLLILAGDLNAEPQSAAMQYLAGLAEIDGSSTHQLRDAWTVFHKEPRPAAPDVYDDLEEHDHGLTFSTLDDDLVKRIDYLFYQKPDDVLHTATDLVDDGGRWEDATSDHVGVKASFMRTS